MQKRFLTLLLTTVLCAAGCASSDDTIPTIKEDTPEQVPETETSTERAVLPETADTPGIRIDTLTDSASYYASEDPGDCVLNVSASYPKVTIAGNPDASDKINDTILQELHTFLAFEKENAGYAEENRKSILEIEGVPPEPYTASLSYEIKRCDEKIVSFVMTQYDFTGGAHGNSWSYGMTFDTAAGTRIYLSALYDSTDSFFKMLSDELAGQAALAAYEKYIDKNIAVDLGEAFLGDSPCWYLDRSGLSFISNPYVLGPYAAGTFEFNIPYDKLDGLKPKYTYEGSYIRKIFPGISVRHDMNKDGVTDEICYSVAFDENFSNPKPVLTVNGADCSDAFESLYLTGPASNAYYLIDVDPLDPFTEIAIADQNPENPDADSTHFFRYNNDKQLIYQGKIPGVFNESMKVCYNSNGNLYLCTPDDTPDKP